MADLGGHRAQSGTFNDQSGPDAARKYFDTNRVAMLEGSEVLWPENEDYYTLMLMRESDGLESFVSEMQNEPVNPADCLFLEEEFQFWDDHWKTRADLITALGTKASWIGACDPSVGKTGKHADNSAIITLLCDTSTGTLYVIDADIKRREPDLIIESVLTCQRMRKYSKFAFESNVFQVLLADELTRRSNAEGLDLPVEAVNHSRDKLARILSLQPLVRAGTVQFSRRHTELLEQMRLGRAGCRLRCKAATTNSRPSVTRLMCSASGLKRWYMSATAKSSQWQVTPSSPMPLVVTGSDQTPFDAMGKLAFYRVFMITGLLIGVC